MSMTAGFLAYLESVDGVVMVVRLSWGVDGGVQSLEQGSLAVLWGRSAKEVWD